MVDVDPSWINKEPDPATTPAYAAAELRRTEAVLMFGGHADRLGAREGVRPGHIPVSLASTTWTVHDSAVTIYPGLTTTSGPYRAALLETSGEHDPPDGTNPRKDIIVAEVKDHEEDASGLRLARPRYIAGVPGTTPSEPAVPAGAFKLATIDVPASGGGSATLTVNNPWTVASGGVLPVRDASELPTAGRYKGMTCYQQDIDALVIWNGTAWEERAPLLVETAWRAAPRTVGTGSWTPIEMDSGDFTGGWTCGRGGWYAIDAYNCFSANATGERTSMLTKNGTDRTTNDIRGTQDLKNAVSGLPTSLILPRLTAQFVAGDTVHMIGWQDSGANLDTSTVNSSTPTMTVTYLGGS